VQEVVLEEPGDIPDCSSGEPTTASLGLLAFIVGVGVFLFAVALDVRRGGTRARCSPRRGSRCRSRGQVAR
jgi:hypothetical protein